MASENEEKKSWVGGRRTRAGLMQPHSLINLNGSYSGINLSSNGVVSQFLVISPNQQRS